MTYTKDGDGIELPAHVAITSRFDSSERLYGIERHGPFAIHASMWPLDGSCMTSTVAVSALLREIGAGNLRPFSPLPA